MKRIQLHNPIITMTGWVASAPTAGDGFGLVPTPFRRLTH